MDRQFARLTRRAAIVGALAFTSPRRATAGDLEEAERLLEEEGRYLPMWSATARAGAKDELRQWAALVGNEAVALQAAPAGFNVTDSDLESARQADAVAEIRRHAKNTRIVILNEAHVCSRHRHFLGQVINALASDGFSCLAVEALANWDLKDTARASALRAGDQIDPSFGGYVRDPVFAEALRGALSLGYRLASYEQRSDQNSRIAEKQFADREDAQTSNIAELFRSLPADKKILVHVGYSHLRETPDRLGRHWLALRLREELGVDPLTVAQAHTGSFLPHGTDSDAARRLLGRLRPKTTVVVYGADGRSIGADQAGADLAVFHPILGDERGRPGWLAADKSRRWLRVSLPETIRRPVMVQAIHSGEKAPAIPADQLLVQERAEIAWLRLRPGRYSIRFETQTGVINATDAHIL